jgi:isopenicillin N synthase-like dioxygenase
MNLHQIDFNSNNANFDFSQSLQHTGFAVLKNHPIDYNLVQDVFEEWATFFSQDYKHDYLFDKNTQDGFFPITVSETAVGYNVKDLKEFYHYYPWGKYPKELTNKTKYLYKQMNDFAIVLLKWVENHLPSLIKDNLSENLAQMIQGSNQTLLRILHYPPISGDEENNAIRAQAHTDINLLTILVAASESGLQVQDNYGNWIDVPVDAGMVAINIGDMLQEATNGYYKSTMHRVINPQGENMNKSRYSIPLFLHPRSDVKLSSKYTAGEFLLHRLKELGLKK